MERGDINMKSARFEYRCRRCGVVFEEGVTSPKQAETFLIDAILNGVSHCNNSIPLTIKTPHRCNESGMGVADLIGFRVIDGI